MKKYINQQEMKRANAADVFQLIRERRGMTRKEIERATGMSWGAVSNIISRLMEEGYVVESKRPGGAGAGRIPHSLLPSGSDHMSIGLDVNRSGLTAVVMDLNGNVQLSIGPISACEARDALLAQLDELTAEAISRVPGRRILSIGVAMQGHVDAERGISVSLPHCPDWKNVPVVQRLQERFGAPVFMEHDPNCMLYAASRQMEIHDAMLLRVDRGVGMSVMLCGEIQNRAGMFEIGHTVFKPDGALCTCGKRGCLECYASMSGMERRAGLPFDELVKRAQSGEEAALSCFLDMAGALAAAVANAAYFLNLPHVLLCGQMWAYDSLFRDAFEEKLSEYAQRDAPLITVLREENAAYGAACLAADRAVRMIRI